jgi:hypothetical protein
MMNQQRIERRLQRWERVRAAGRKRFIVLWGVLAWGIPGALLFSILIIRQEHQGFASGVGTIAASLITFPLGGILFGYSMWIMCECMYRVQKWRLSHG